jgi:hypothetical protein
MFKPTRIQAATHDFVHPEGFTVPARVSPQYLTCFGEKRTVVDTHWNPSDRDIINLINGGFISIRNVGDRLPALWLTTTEAEPQFSMSNDRKHYAEHMLAMCAMIRKLDVGCRPAQVAMDQVVIALKDYCEGFTK